MKRNKSCKNNKLETKGIQIIEIQRENYENKFGSMPIEEILNTDGEELNEHQL